MRQRAAPRVSYRRRRRRPPPPPPHFIASCSEIASYLFRPAAAAAVGTYVQPGLPAAVVARSGRCACVQNETRSQPASQPRHCSKVVTAPGQEHRACVSILSFLLFSPRLSRALCVSLSFMSLDPAPAGLPRTRHDSFFRDRPLILAS